MALQVYRISQIFCTLDMTPGRIFHTVNLWNSLTAQVVLASSVNDFKNTSKRFTLRE